MAFDKFRLVVVASVPEVRFVQVLAPLLWVLAVNMADQAAGVVVALNESSRSYSKLQPEIRISIKPLANARN